MAFQGKRLATPVLLSVILHAAAAVLAGWIIVTQRQVAPPPETLTPEAKSQTALPATESGASRTSPLSNPSFIHQQAPFIRSLALAGLAAPPLPKVERSAAEKSPRGGVLLESAGTVSLSSRHIGLGEALAKGLVVPEQALLPTPQFLGTPVTGEKIMLLFDVSKTVANAAARSGMPMEKIREETARLLDSLGIHARFGLLEFARNYALFRPELVAATRANREAAHQWLNRYFSTDGTLGRNIPHTVSGSPGFLVALEHAFQLDPDSLFILSDGNFQRGNGLHGNIPWSELEACLNRLQRQRETPAKLHFIGVATKTDAAQNLRRILPKYGGVYSEMVP